MSNIRKAVLISLGGLILFTSGCSYMLDRPVPSIKVKNGFVQIDSTAIRINKIDRVDSHRTESGRCVRIFTSRGPEYTYYGTTENGNLFQSRILNIIQDHDK